jgi:hypothetical protein
VTGIDNVINLTIPVVGDMTDPSYTFHSAYGKKLRSLISKASVSPFSLLTDFYDAEQTTPDHILFKAGTSELTSEFESSLGVIKTILEARPLLALTIKGYSAGTEDRDALLKTKQEEAERKRLALQNSMSEDIIVSYGQEEIATPPLLPGNATPSLTVSKEELLSLAKERCLRIHEILIEQYQVAEERISISPEVTVVPTTGAGLAGNRVDLLLGRLTPATQ